MTEQRTFVIVGASLAGAKAAETLRSQGFDGRVVLIGQEDVRPYERPPLSKAYLRGEVGFDKAAVHPEEFYKEHDIELLTSTTVTALDAAAQEVELAPGGRLGYDQLLLATGASPRRLDLPGADLDGIHYLRDIHGCDRLRDALGKASRVVVVGTGWIGSEVAASARQLGKEVALLGKDKVPLEKVLGHEVGAMFQQLHADHGVELHMGVGVQAFSGSGAVEGVVLDDASVVAGDLVVVGAGVVPRTDLASASGLALDNGVLADQYLATSAPGIRAAGDVANAYHPFFATRIRLEHWSSALNQGPVAAQNMLGQRTEYTKLPYFFSDQYDLGMEYTGFAPHWDQIVYRGNRESRQVIVFWLDAGRVVAGMNVNVWDVADQIAALISSRQVVGPHQLADPATDLALLAQGRG